MRLGYGYKRQRSDFEPFKVKRVWIDFPGTQRREREDMLLNGVRPGDTIVLLSSGDLGAGGEIPMLRKHIEEMRVTIEVIPQEKEPAATRGRPAKFVPTNDERARLKRMYLDPRYSGRHVYSEGCAMAGWPDDAKSRERMRQWLFNQFGKRGS